MSRSGEIHLSAVTAAGWATRTPVRPQELASAQRARTDPRHPYEAVAADIARRVESGELRGGEPAPTADELAVEHGVSVSTARRAVALARDWGVSSTTVWGGHESGSLVRPPYSWVSTPQPKRHRICRMVRRPTGLSP